MRSAARLAVAVLAGTALVAGTPGLAPAAATAPERQVPVPVASIVGQPSPRLDQDTSYTATFTGASRAASVSVTWGDGASSRGRSPCAVAKAVKRPASCQMRMSHRYTSAGTFPVTVRSGARIIARTSVTIREAPRPWSPPPGWVQPAGWRFFDGGATYAPCSTVSWTYDRSSEPSDATGMRADIEKALTRLAAQTGLTFRETSDVTSAMLTYSWGDLGADYSEAAGVGGRKGSTGYVTFSTTHWWPRDDWAGFDVVTQPDGTYAAGRGWLVVHETMHALGVDHVDDPTQVMSPVAGLTTEFGSGDVDALRTMYLDNPCPA